MAAATATSVTTASSSDASSLGFVVFGDWGKNTADVNVHLSHMIRAAALGFDGHKIVPSHVIALGDNFYHSGVATHKDKRLEAWAATFGSDANMMPWLLVPGNHDYHPSSGISAQLNFSDDTRRNPFRKWCMGSVVSTTPAALQETEKKSLPAPPPRLPPPPPRNKAPVAFRIERSDDSEAIDVAGAPKITAVPSAAVSSFPCRVPWALRHFAAPDNSWTMDLFLLDTCATQWSVRRKHPHVLEKEWPQQAEWLRRELKGSQATWKVVCGHHPLFTIGRGHQDEARCLRGSAYTSVADPNQVRDGLGLLDILHDGDVDVYLAGHEHWFQSANDVKDQHTLRTFVCGNVMESHLWMGPYLPRALSEYNAREDAEIIALAKVQSETASSMQPLLKLLDETPAEAAQDLRAGAGAASALLDPHRSVLSVMSHVSEECGEVGILRMIVAGTNITLQLVGLRHEILFQTHFCKESIAAGKR